MRKFLVVGKEGPPGQEVVGVTALAKLLNVPEQDIPPLRLYKYSVGEYTVFERGRNPNDKSNAFE